MATYTVEINRTATRTLQLKIDAASPEEARMIALDTAGDLEFPSEPDAEYEATVLGVRHTDQEGIVVDTGIPEAKGEEAEIVQVLHASTAHLTREEADFLITRNCYPPRRVHPRRRVARGYIHLGASDVAVHIALHPEEKCSGVSDGFRQVAQYARDRGIGYIRFDRDARQVPGCTTYKW